METEEVNHVLEREKAARAYPSGMTDDFFYDADDDEDRNQSECRYCDAKNCPDRVAPYVPDGLQVENCDEDKDMENLRSFSGILDEIAVDLPPELTAVIKKVFSKHGKNGPFPDQQEVRRKDPWLADLLLREIRRADADGNLPDINPNSMPGWLPRY
jgi:hypothetical protein